MIKSGNCEAPGRGILPLPFLLLSFFYPTVLFPIIVQKECPSFRFIAFPSIRPPGRITARFPFTLAVLISSYRIAPVCLTGISGLSFFSSSSSMLLISITWCFIAPEKIKSYEWMVSYNTDLDFPWCIETPRIRTWNKTLSELLEIPFYMYCIFLFPLFVSLSVFCTHAPRIFFMIKNMSSEVKSFFVKHPCHSGKSSRGCRLAFSGVDFFNQNRYWSCYLWKLGGLYWSSTFQSQQHCTCGQYNIVLCKQRFYKFHTLHNTSSLLLPFQSLLMLHSTLKKIYFSHIIFSL